VIAPVRCLPEPVNPITTEGAFCRRGSVPPADGGADSACRPLLSDTRSVYTEISATIEFQGATYVAQVSELAAVDPVLLRNLAGDLRDYEDGIRRAIDRLLTGI
jgi:hypothetical protein